MKKMTLVILLFFACSLFSGCYDRREIDDLAYVIAIGFDKGTTNILRMTLQLAVPTAIGGGGEGGGGGGGGEKALTLTSIDTPTIYTGLNMVNTYLSKQLNMSHAKIVVFSEELAREGIGQYIHALIRGREFRPNMTVIVAKGRADEFIKSNKPVLEINPAKLYELILGTYRYTGFIANTQLINFYLQEESSYHQAVAVLAGVSKYENVDEFSSEDSTAGKKNEPMITEGDYIAGNIPRIGFGKSEIMGLAVFDGDRMVGELDGEETLYHLMLSGQYNHSSMSIRDPLVKDKLVVLNVIQSRKPVHKVRLVDGKPKIYAQVRLEADILSIQSGKNYEDIKNTGILEKAAEDQIREGMLQCLNKTSKVFHTDICGFGKEVKKKVLTWEDWLKVDWLKKYKDASFTVDVDLKIRRPGLLIRTVPGYSIEGRD